MHGMSTSMLLLLHSTFMLSVVKILLKGEFGGRALNSNGFFFIFFFCYRQIVMEIHGKIMELCF